MCLGSAPPSRRRGERGWSVPLPPPALEARQPPKGQRPHRGLFGHCSEAGPGIPNQGQGNKTHPEHFRKVSPRLRENFGLGDYEQFASVPVGNTPMSSVFPSALSPSTVSAQPWCGAQRCTYAPAGSQASPTTRSTLRLTPETGGQIEAGIPFCTLPGCPRCTRVPPPLDRLHLQLRTASPTHRCS